jgi:periplasmic divalent cation tolerance protein
MKRATQFAVVFVTAPSVKIARLLARAVLEEHLAVCANLVPGLESHYWWQGKMERSREVLIIFKTTRGRLKALEKLVLAKHPYDTPEFVVLPIVAGTERYLDWLKESVIMGN